MNNYSEWQSIDTAPKDGTIVLLYNGYTQMGFYDGVHWLAMFNKNLNVETEPTHWMFLPEPPKTKMNTNNTWQSIDTAPKDGTWILGLDLENKEAEIVRWSSKEDYINRSKAEGTSNWKYKPYEGWSCYAYSCAYSRPTHWCSIPELPK